MSDSPSIAGMVPTGRRLAGPGLEIRELAAPNGLKHLAYVHPEGLRDHPALGPDLQARLSFMEQPDVGGLVRLAFHDPATAAFLYPTGTVWTLAEVVRQFADLGDAPGVKAGLELCYLVAETLVEAAEAGVGQGIPGHGNVNPWTLGLKSDGQPVVLLYGVPQVELLAWRENPKRALTEDSFRYAPPERIEGEPEDVSSDLLSLALVALETMVGRPVYDGVLADVRQQATRGEGVRRLYQWREKLPQNVREVMGRALKPDPDTRFPNGMDFVYAVHDLLGSIDVEGPSLVEVMAKVRASERRQRAAGSKTGMLSPAELREMAADLEEFEDRPLPPPRRARADEPVEEEPADKPRWTRASRQLDRASPAGETRTPAVEGSRERGPAVLGNRPRTPAPSDGTGATERPRRRLRTEAASPAASPVPEPAAGTDDSSARDRLRRRLREPRLSESAPFTAPVPMPPPTPSARNVRAAPEPAPPPPAPEPAPAPPPAAAEEPSLATTPVDLVGIDLSAPDDVDLEPVTGRPPLSTLELQELALDDSPAPAPARAEPAPEPPREAPREATGVRRRTRRGDPPPLPVEIATVVDDRPPDVVRDASLRRAGRGLPEDPASERSAAAALLERLRTSGGRRRRPLGPTPGDPAPEATELETAIVDLPPPAPVPSLAPSLAVGPSARAPLAVAPPPFVAPVAECVVTLGEAVAPVQLRAGEGVGSVALRAAAELGALPFDAAGRLLGAVRLCRDGREVPSATRAEPGVRYELKVEPADLRVLEVEIAGDPVTRLRTPVATGLPCGWLVRHLTSWLGLPTGTWVLRVGDEEADPAAPLVEVLGTASTIRLDRR